MIAASQITITDLNDPVISGSAPEFPSVDTLWIDPTVEPNQLKRWDGSAWIIVTDQSALDAYKQQVNSQIDTITGDTNTNIEDIVALKENMVTFMVQLDSIVSSLSEKVGNDELITKINQSASKILLSVIENINSITTTTGYTFDANGLQITSTSSGIKVKIDNDEVTFSNLDGTEIITRFTAVDGALMTKAKVTDSMTIGNLDILKVVIPSTNENRTWIVFNG